MDAPTRSLSDMGPEEIRDAVFERYGCVAEAPEEPHGFPVGREFAEAVERGPIPAIHGVVRWRLIDLAHWLHEEFAVSLDETTVSRELKKLGYVKLTARPRHHAQNGHAMEAFKKGALPRRWQRSGPTSRRARP